MSAASAATVADPVRTAAGSFGGNHGRLLESVVSGEAHYLSTAQVAQSLGLSVTTIKRWVDDGVLAAHRTVGGHRKVLMADVLRLMRENELPEADLGKLFPRYRKAALAHPEGISAQLLAALKAADQAAVRAIVHGAYRHGFAMDVLADRVIGPAMDMLGRDWEAGRVAVMQEHRATQAIVSALYELAGTSGVQPDRNRPLAVGGAPEGDPTLVPTLLAKLVLASAGWEAVNLGPHTPVAAFLTAIHELRPRLVWVCVTHLQDADRFLRTVQELRHEAEARGVAVAVGGRAVSQALRERMRCSTVGDGMSDLAAFARTLYQRPAVPKKGRPRHDEGEHKFREGRDRLSP
jgi:excisionase family DNA binding protein